MFRGRLVIIIVTGLLVDRWIERIPVSPHSGLLTNEISFFDSSDSYPDIRSVLTRSDSPPGMLNVRVDSHPDIRTVLTRYAHYLPQRS